jgi:hypothetical protein
MGIPIHCCITTIYSIREGSIKDSQSHCGVLEGQVIAKNGLMGLVIYGGALWQYCCCGMGRVWGDRAGIMSL